MNIIMITVIILIIINFGRNITTINSVMQESINTNNPIFE